MSRLGHHSFLASTLLNARLFSSCQAKVARYATILNTSKNTRLSSTLAESKAAPKRTAPARQPYPRRKPIQTNDQQIRKRIRTIDREKLDTISKSLIEDLYKETPASTTVVTLEDVLALKPKGDSNKVSPEEFNKLKDILSNSFNVIQLKSVLRSQKMPTTGKKAALLNQIMVLMDLEVVVPEVKETAPVMEDPYSAAASEADFESQEFSSNRRDLSFILGSEGDALRKLEREKNVRISINIGDNTYTIRGTKESIEEAKAAIQEMVAVTEESWDISGYADRESVTKRPSALEEIALGSKTFVAAGEDDTLIISGRSRRDMDEAKRLFDLKMQKKDTAAEILTFLHQEDDRKPLGMFPVFDTVSMSSSRNNASYFRISQTEPFAEKTGNSLAIVPVGSSPSIGKFDALRQHLLETLAQHSGQSLDLAAHVGQVLFHNRGSQITDMPLLRSFDTNALKTWMDQSEAPIFSQSFPFFKTVSKLPMVGDKTRTIEVEYVGSALSCVSVVSPIRFTFELDADGQLRLQSGRSVNIQHITNIMLLGQPTDIQIRSEFSSELKADRSDVAELLRKIGSPAAHVLEAPKFFSFQAPSSEAPAASQVGLSHPYTLKSILFKTTGVFNYKDLPLVATDIYSQYGSGRMQQLKLLPTPLTNVSNTERAFVPEPDVASALSTPETWDTFFKFALALSRGMYI
ncbi:hypothetical protein BGZ93_006375 [Podila epicladia]|nr:hypothetical protein BGZ92_011083 [Podila epicladia]KAG0095068.1 hypothetical protein BGZ93_006375 [Podila epicladia]